MSDFQRVAKHAAGGAARNVFFFFSFFLVFVFSVVLTFFYVVDFQRFFDSFPLKILFLLYKHNLLCVINGAVNLWKWLYIKAI